MGDCQHTGQGRKSHFHSGGDGFREGSDLEFRAGQAATVATTAPLLWASRPGHSVLRSCGTFGPTSLLAGATRWLMGDYGCHEPERANR